ncbi:CRISPR-associated endoribonuclease Cas2 1 [Frankliniella fusca]|uniref:CRISPR-associated endoribonuclease Cas2 1 n=1 Tax=Frankliniella fusca TaxID=407009 RepID=A0AAE1I165_9NEOP|nr:CRISPR-associated endoribonuclease Cas2 1 [Frankliniella fusca]
MELGLGNLDNLTGIFYNNIQERTTIRYSVLIFTLTCIIVIFNCFSFLMKAVLIHEAIPKINQQRAVNAIWHVIFSVVVLIYSINLNIIWDGNFSLKEILTKKVLKPQCNSTVQILKEQQTFNDFGTLVLPVAFFLHQLYLSTSFYKEPDVSSTVGYCLFFYASYTLQCPNLCLKVLSLLALDMGSMELARAIYALKSRQKGFKGPNAPLFLRMIAMPSFFLHVVAWSIINLYTIPLLFLSLPSVPEVDTSFRLATGYINIFIVCLAKQRLFDSLCLMVTIYTFQPVWYLFKMLVTRPSDFKRMRSLQSLPVILLLPYTSQLLPELKAIQMDFLLNAIPTSSAERRLMRRKILSANGVKILKRKMRNRYEQRIGNEVGENDHENLENETTGTECASESDVTDIFVPVPSTSLQKDIGTSNEMERVAEDDSEHKDLGLDENECGKEIQQEGNVDDE